MKKMSKGMLMTALICGAVYLGGSPVYASELQEFSLDEYVVTAARTETKLVDTPANISVVDAQTIEERHYQNVAETLKDVPGVTVLDSGIGTAEKAIKLNGDERVLVLVDGRRVSTDMGLTNSSRANFDTNQLPDVGLIERIEVLKGAGGALYGSDAVGGVINIITKKADRAFGKVSAGYGSNDARDFSAMYSIKEAKTGVTVSASKEKQGYYKFKDYSSNRTTKWNFPSDYENNKVSLKIDQAMTADMNFTVGYDYSKYDGNSPSTFGLNTQEKETKNIYAKFDWLHNQKDSGYVQVYHNEMDYENIGVCYPDGSPSTSVGIMKEKVNGIDLQQVFTVSDANKIVVGANYRKSDVKAKGDNNYDESIDNLSLYVSDSWEFIPSWTVTAGMRYDDHSEAGDDTTLSAGLNKKFNDDSHMYFTWSQVFKAPNADDLYYFADMGGGYIYKGNPELNPETGETWTVGYSTVMNRKTELNINYFESDLDDAINYLYDVVTGYNVATNIDSQKKQGMELSVKHKINDNLDFVASYTYLKAKNKTQYTNGFVRDGNIIPNMYRVGVNYRDGKWDSNIYLRYGSGAGDAYTNSYGSTSRAYLDNEYLTVDLAITYKADEAWSFYAKGYNLFNEAYAEFGGHDGSSYNYPAQSRRFIVGAEYKF